MATVLRIEIDKEVREVVVLSERPMTRAQGWFLADSAMHFTPGIYFKEEWDTGFYSQYSVDCMVGYIFKINRNVEL